MTKLQEILDAIKVQKNRDRYLEWQIGKTISMHHGLSEREMEEQIGHLYRAVTSDLDANLVCRTVVSKIAPESIRIIAERLLLTYTGSATPNAPSRDLVSLPKDSQEIISEKLSQNDADVVTKRQASEIEQRAAVALLSERADFLRMYVTNLKGAPVSNSVLYTWARFYTEAYDYAKSIGAIETLNHSNTKTQGE